VGRVPLIAAPPPLSADAQIALGAAVDGRDHNETAFDYLVADVRAWPADVSSADTTAPADWLAIVSNDETRGTSVVLTGVLAQKSRLEQFWDGTDEWFVRVQDGPVVCAFVVDPPAVGVGATVTILGRAYKRIDATARDGTLRQYPAIVGRVLTQTAGPSASSWLAPIIVLTMIVIVMLIAYALLRARVRAVRRAKGRRPAPRIIPPFDGRPDHADDVPAAVKAAEALALLRDRSNP